MHNHVTYQAERWIQGLDTICSTAQRYAEKYIRAKSDEMILQRCCIFSLAYTPVFYAMGIPEQVLAPRFPSTLPH